MPIVLKKFDINKISNKFKKDIEKSSEEFFD